MAEENAGREWIDKVLAPHGWTFVWSKMAGPAVVEYTVERTVDGRRSILRRTFAEMLLNPIDKAADETVPEIPVALTLLLGLLRLVKDENRAHPVAPTETPA